jgi:hypothetical protein
MKISLKIACLISSLIVGACNVGQASQSITENQKILVSPTVFSSPTPNSLTVSPTFSSTSNNVQPKLVVSPMITVTKSLTDIVLQSSSDIKLLDVYEVSEFVVRETEFPETMDMEETLSNQDGTVKVYLISACSYCDYHADKYDNLICKDLAKKYRDTSNEEGLSLCIQRLFFADTATNQLYELDWLPRLGYRPITSLAWVGNDIITFQIWSQPKFGTGYIFDIKRRKFIFVGTIADKSW